MKLEKAIKIAKDMLYRRTISLSQDQKDTLELLIEAGKRVQWHKEQHERGYYELLPGETED